MPEALPELPPPEIDWATLPSPCYIVDEGRLVRNLELLRDVARAAECRILLAQKGFSMFYFYPLISEYLSGAASSSLNEARLAEREMKGEVHIYSPAYRKDEFDEISKICSHIVFNSFTQLRKFRGSLGGAQAGIRVNPGYSEIDVEIYNPCAPFSRFGVPHDTFSAEATRNDFVAGGDMNCLTGLHFHTMCEQNSDTLERTLGVVCDKFGRFIPNFKWVNFGGGHHITRPDYDVGKLVRCVRGFARQFGVDIYLEPGEAIALNTGYLVSTVLDVINNGMMIAVMDASAACHMPDVLEMPYRPHIIGSADPSSPDFDDAKYPFTYRLGGPTCLAGDIIGDYAFERPLAPGRRLVFTDMAHYTMVKNNTFNGIGLPAIAVNTRDGVVKIIREFGYEDFRRRLS